MKSQGTSLIELTVGASLMGLLFLSGLQLLSSMFSVQSHLMPSHNAINYEPLLLKTQLQQTLQEARVLNVSPDHLSLHFQYQGEEHSLRFKSTVHSWYLWQNQAQVAHWPTRTEQPKPGFKISADNLLEITLPNEETPVLIWLRNHAAT